MTYRIPDIPFLTLKLCMISEGDAVLPVLKGSMIRGAFGNALRRTVCVMSRGQVCETCMLRVQCAYTRIFETFVEGEPPPFFKNVKTSPRPFIIDAPAIQTDYKTGADLEFTMTLLGRACEYYPYAIFAFIRAAETGLTRRRSRFRLERVDWLNRDWEMLYDSGRKALVGLAASRTIPQDCIVESPAKLSFITPTRLMMNGRLSTDFTFRGLAFKMLSRALEIAHFHVPGARPDWEFREFIKLADDVRIVKNRLHWDDWKRYSSRQKTRMLMGGFIGDITLEGNLAPFSGLLRTSEVLHVGKGTVFGLGKVRVEESPFKKGDLKGSPFS